jgi:hypothetical protein
LPGLKHSLDMRGLRADAGGMIGRREDVLP